MKWNEMSEMSVERNGVMKFVIEDNGEIPQQDPTQAPFRPPWNPNGVTETRTRDPSDGRRVTIRLLRLEAAYDVKWLTYLHI